MSGAGIGVRFCGAPTTFPAGPAQLALRTGASLLTLAPTGRR
jgi:lauroyl/myristoyl acyltransferase